jgi:hypothetical protein
MIDLSIIIVSWNVRDLLRRCLHSITNNRLPITDNQSPITDNQSPITDNQSPITDYRLETIVVDNASHDGSVEMVRTEYPHVRLIANVTNRGFTGGNNDGLHIARGRYVLLLNPDTEVIGNALATLVAYADSHPQVGALGPQVLNPDGSVQSSRRRFPTLATALFESTWLQSLAPRGVLERYYALDLPNDQPAEVDWVTGAALMVRREAMDQVGMMDEGFFMYSEELDWCKRIKAAGWQVAYMPSAQIIHHEGKSSEQVVPQRHIYFQTSKVRYFRKHHGALAASSLRMYLLALYAWQLAFEAAKWLIGSKRAVRRERVQAYWKVLKSGLTNGY